MKPLKGFTLIEILIVLIIVGLLAYIAIPNILRTHVSVKERSIRELLSSFHEANEAYRKSQNPARFAASIDELVDPKPGQLRYLDLSWKNPIRDGYKLTYFAGSDGNFETYALLASPLPNSPGVRETYCIDHKGLMRMSKKGHDIPLGAESGCTGGIEPVVP